MKHIVIIIITTFLSGCSSESGTISGLIERDNIFMIGIYDILTHGSYNFFSDKGKNVAILSNIESSHVIDPRPKTVYLSDSEYEYILASLNETIENADYGSKKTISDTGYVQVNATYGDPRGISVALNIMVPRIKVETILDLISNNYERELTQQSDSERDPATRGP